MKNTILFFILPLLAACTKGGPAEGRPSPVGAWRQVSETANGQNLWVTYYHEPCRLDDQWYFYPGGRYALRDSGITCGPGGEQPGTWQADGDSFLLDSLSYSIVELSDQALRLQRQRMMNGFPVLYEIGFTRP